MTNTVAAPTVSGLGLYPLTLITPPQTTRATAASPNAFQGSIRALIARET